MKKIYLTIIFIGLISPFNFAKIPPKVSPHPTTFLTIGYNQMGFDLLNECQKELDATKNIAISPLSIGMAMSIAKMGSNGNSKTELTNVMYQNDYGDFYYSNGNKDLLTSLINEERDCELSINNSIWNREDISFLESYRTSASYSFDAEVKSFKKNDPNANDLINGWIEEKTNGVINNLIDEVTPNQLFFLINTLYFKGDWKYEFIPELTGKFPFYYSNGTSSEVPMMCQVLYNCPYYSSEELTAIELPFSDDKYSMSLLLPGEKNSATNLISSLNKELFFDIADNFQPKFICLRLPKFKVDYKSSLKKAFQALGVNNVFEEANADFSNMTTSHVFIDKIIHQSVIDVTEKGVEAAASTAVAMGGNSGQVPLDVNFNKPFLFLINHKESGSILFVGKVANPQNEIIPQIPTSSFTKQQDLCKIFYNKSNECVVIENRKKAEGENLQIELINLSGQVIKKTTSQASSSTSIPVSNIESNLYLLKIHTSSGIQTQKVLIH